MPDAPARRRGHAHVALRRHGRGAAAARPARLVDAVPPRGRARAARRARRAGGGSSSARAAASRRAALVPRRDDLRKIAVIGSGPIVIGQACEFDYSGVQALRVLREEGYETVLVNSNPATIMTDPGWADRTYIEPLDLEGVASVLRRERPDALLPTLGGQTALNMAMELDGAGVLDELGIELIGASDRGHRDGRGPRALRGLHGERAACAAPAPRSRTRSTRRGSCSPAATLPAAARDPAGLHARRAGRRLRGHARRSSTRVVARGVAGLADLAGAGRGVGQGLGRVRARGDPRPRGQRDHRLLDREPRPDGRAHGRLGLRGAGHDAVRPRVPDAARRRRPPSSARSASRRAARTCSSRWTARPASSWSSR